MSDKIDQLKKIGRLYAGTTSAGEKAAAAAAFRRRRVSTPYAAHSIEEFLSLRDAVPHRPWPKRRKSTTFVRTREHQEALRREVERRWEKKQTVCRETRNRVLELLAWDRRWDELWHLYVAWPLPRDSQARFSEREAKFLKEFEWRLSVWNSPTDDEIGKLYRCVERMRELEAIRQTWAENLLASEQLRRTLAHFDGNSVRSLALISLKNLMVCAR
jgi:hypothetical protein